MRNAGDGGSSATTLRYFRSADATIGGSDAAVGTDAVGSLSAAGTSAESIGLTAPTTAGAYYYGACVDAVAGESDTANNCSASVKVDVGNPTAPDLQVGTPTARDASPETGGSFTLTATVRNAGDGGSSATTLRYFRSADATIGGSDAAVGTDAVGSLSASGTSAESIGLTAPTTAGAYYYGACVDAVAGESDTTNNCSASVKVDVGNPTAPDLQVGTPTASDASPETGGSFTLTATVRNAGDGGSSATTLRYFRSADATIGGSDAAVGTDAVGSLSASGTSAESIGLTAPTTPGAYYYGACVDAVAGESDTTNNCSASVKVDVGNPTAPDLQVGTPTASDASPETGGSFILTATVRNAGDGGSSATTLRYFRSSDATIGGSDAAVGTDAVGSLSASGTSAESIGLTAPTTAGAYYYGACVDAVAGESDTTNNCSASVKVDVGNPTAPDLQVGTPTASDASPETGGSFTLTATVRNAGDGGSSATTLRYFRSADATIGGSDAAVGTDAVGSLSASGTSAESIGLTAPTTPGAYYYGACVDAVAGESDTTNNCSASVKVDVGNPTAPDLQVGTPTASDASPETGGSFILTATVRNAGDGGSSATTLRYFRSSDATIGGSDAAVGTDAVGSLSASGTSAEWIGLTAPTTPGAYYYGACVDSVAGESNASNNCSPGIAVTVIQPRPDLSVQRPSVSNSTPDAGDPFTLSVTVRNDGDGDSGATTLRYYRSVDATIDDTDTPVGTDALAGLAVQESSNESIVLNAPTDVGTYYYGACADTVTDESDTTNNCSAPVEVTVEAPKYPDLVVGAPTVSESGPETGDEFTLSATVTNAGDAAAASTTLRYYRSTDATISTSDTEVGTDAVEALAASSASPQSIALTAPSAVGTYYYGACVDPVGEESDTGNNCSDSVQITVTLPGFPNLSVEASSTRVNAWCAKTRIEARVHNAGSGAAESTTLRYYRSADAVASPDDDEEIGTSDVPALAPSAAWKNVLKRSTESGTRYYYVCVDSPPNETNADDNCSVPIVSTTVVGFDLIGDSAIVGFEKEVRLTVASNEFFSYGTIFGSVSNRGIGIVARRYRSEDSTISTDDKEDGLILSTSFSACGGVWWASGHTAPSTPGIYYYGGCVDVVEGELDTTNNCTSALEVTVE